MQKSNFYYIYHVYNSKDKATPKTYTDSPLKATKDKNGSYKFKVKKNVLTIPYLTYEK